MGIVFNAMSCEAERKVKHENKEETQNTCRGKQSWKLETKEEKVEAVKDHQERWIQHDDQPPDNSTAAKWQNSLQ